MKNNISSLSLKLNILNQKGYSFMKKIFPIFTFEKEFGKDNAMKLKKSMSDRYAWLDTCYEIIDEDLEDFIKNYKFESPVYKDNKIIWICWLQGIDKVPDVVSMCIKSIKRNAPMDVKVNLVDLNNISDYITIPDDIYKRFLNHNLAACHFSDVIRFGLLKTYGGIWIDSTVFVSDEIPSSYFDLDIYSIQRADKENRYKDLYYDCLSSYLIGGKNSCALFDFIYNYFIVYLRKHKYIIEGHWINIAYKLVYEHNICNLRDEIDEIGVNNPNKGTLYKEINNKYSPEIWKNLTENQMFHKLNWRTKYIAKVGNDDTIYGHIEKLNK